MTSRRAPQQQDPHLNTHYDTLCVCTPDNPCFHHSLDILTNKYNMLLTLEKEEHTAQAYQQSIDQALYHLHNDNQQDIAELSSTFKKTIDACYHLFSSFLCHLQSHLFNKKESLDDPSAEYQKIYTSYQMSKEALINALKEQHQQVLKKTHHDVQQARQHKNTYQREKGYALSEELLCSRFIQLKSLVENEEALLLGQSIAATKLKIRQHQQASEEINMRFERFIHLTIQLTEAQCLDEVNLCLQAFDLYEALLKPIARGLNRNNDYLKGVIAATEQAMRLYHDQIMTRYHHYCHNTISRKNAQKQTDLEVEDALKKQHAEVLKALMHPNQDFY